ncbi:type I-E CRISPR-associated protein Cas5/CasD [Rhodocaloribacter sp.]
MTYTLLMRLAGPMQSWGLQSRFSIRDTAREPTKSGVLGLVCAALGRSRDAPIDDLRALRMGVRVDREGLLRRDFHTARDIVKASATIRPGKPISPGQRKDTEPSMRHYLADAWFTVALSGPDRALLERIDRALGAPRWPLSLGRKAFVPGLPVRILTPSRPLGVQEGDPIPHLRAFRDPLGKDASERWRFVLDAELAGEDIEIVQIRMQPDDPLSFRSRRFLPRRVVVGYARPLAETGT